MVLGFRKRTTEPVVTDVTESRPDAERTEIQNEAGLSTGVDDGGFNAESGLDQLKKFKATHQWDYNLDIDQIEGVDRVLESGDVEKEANFEHALLEEDSPYFEVRAAVRNYDE